MMTTRRGDGHLQSRAMATQRPARGADLWFVTLDGTARSTTSRAIRTSTLVKGWSAGTTPELGEMHRIEPSPVPER